MAENKRTYDLEERTAKFGEGIVIFCKSIKESTITKPLINQLIRSGTGVGANYMEANGASSKRDFRNKIFICKKEGQETKHWLRMLALCIEGEDRESAKKLWKEVHKLVLIFHKIAVSSK